MPDSPRVSRWLAVAITVLAPAGPLAAQQHDRAALVRAIDSIAMAPVHEGKVAGMSIAVVRGLDTIVLRGYGMADLELETPTPDRAVYEIGSITKQFTAVAILQLRDRGLLSLDDALTTYLPDYPTRGHHITIRRLLDHTSGIKGYTEIRAAMGLAREVLPRDSLVALFAAEPFDFAPGEAMIYNNSAYFLLGLIIEKVSGQSYEEYVAEHLFAQAGMADSRYCSERALIPRKVKGYDTREGHLVPKAFLVHLWPYSAGSLCSTVGDLVAWNRALHADRAGGPLLTPVSYRELITPGTLADGTQLRYAMGLVVAELGGRRQIAHGGGIFGFLSHAAYFPDDDLTVVVLINSAGPVGPGGVAAEIVNRVLGEPAPPSAAPEFPGDLEALSGRYSGPARGRTLTLTVAVDSGGTGITTRAGNRDPQPLRFVAGRTFARGNGRFTFVERNGEIAELRVDQVSGYYILRRTP